MDDEMWDDDFTSKKFELGRVIERETADEIAKKLKDLELIEKKNKENYDRGRIIKTTDIDFFLNCDKMNDQ